MFSFLKMRVTRFEYKFPENDLSELKGVCNISAGIGIPETDSEAPVKCRIEVLFQSHTEDQFYLKMVAVCDFSSDASYSNKDDYFKAANSECTPIAMGKVDKLISETTEHFYGIPIKLPLDLTK